MRDDSARASRIHCQLATSFAHEVRPASLRRAVQAALESAGSELSGELTVVITDDAQVRELNRVHRGVDASTDVLAFGSDDELGAFVSSPDAAPYLGDVVIPYPRVVEQAAEYGHLPGVELSILVVHGVLHLLGYDHEEASDREDMWRAQSDALRRLGIHWQP